MIISSILSLATAYVPTFRNSNTFCIVAPRLAAYSSNGRIRIWSFWKTVNQSRRKTTYIPRFSLTWKGNIHSRYTYIKYESLQCFYLYIHCMSLRWCQCSSIELNRFKKEIALITYLYHKLTLIIGYT